MVGQAVNQICRANRRARRIRFQRELSLLRLRRPSFVHFILVVTLATLLCFTGSAYAKGGPGHGKKRKLTTAPFAVKSISDVQALLASAGIQTCDVVHTGPAFFEAKGYSDTQIAVGTSTVPCCPPGSASSSCDPVSQPSVDAVAFATRQLRDAAGPIYLGAGDKPLVEVLFGQYLIFVDAMSGQPSLTAALAQAAKEPGASIAYDQFARNTSGCPNGRAPNGKCNGQG
jgi:hypothetical protein